jgi:hypothetical protein
MNKLKWILSQPAGQEVAAAFGVAIIALAFVIGVLWTALQMKNKSSATELKAAQDSCNNCNKNSAKHDQETATLLLNYVMNQNKDISKIQTGLDTITSNSKKITAIINKK